MSSYCTLHKYVTNFTKNTDLMTHILSAHEGKQPFTCNTCDAKFSNKGQLNHHISSIHEVKLKREFQCSTCNSKFSREILVTV